MSLCVKNVSSCVCFYEILIILLFLSHYQAIDIMEECYDMDYESGEDWQWKGYVDGTSILLAKLPEGVVVDVVDLNSHYTNCLTYYDLEMSVPFHSGNVSIRVVKDPKGQHVVELDFN